MKKMISMAAILAVITLLVATSFPDKPVEALSKYGSRGQEVREIQTRLKRWGYYTGNIDGIYGYLTYQAVRQFQSTNGLQVDGIAGARTLAAIGIATGTTAGDRELDLLARLVHSEARGEPYTGKVAVAATVLNRTRDSRFPKTVAGVIYQPRQYTPVSNGQINLAPDDSSIRAARDAMNGWDPTGGCVFYWNPATATSRWVWSRPVKLRIGKHVFAM
ncbi:MAG TPA: spore cortex-lytic enzyme [Clostridiales bacterium]|nr:spore cortex-lytic enzyme [Clostridiales bacterium]